MSTKANEDRRNHARILYMSGEQQNIIADKVGVTKQTVNRWVAEGTWDKLRAAKNITRPELVNKILRATDKLLEKVLENSDNDDALDGFSDKLSKLTSAIEKLDKKANVVDAIEVFMAFGRWLQERALIDSELTAELIKSVNRYQDLYVSGQLNNN